MPASAEVSFGSPVGRISPTANLELATQTDLVLGGLLVHAAIVGAPTMRDGIEKGTR